MELTRGKKKFLFTKEVLACSSVLTDLYEQFGSQQEISRITEQELELLYRVLAEDASFQLEELYLFDYFCVNPSILQKRLHPFFTEFEYIITEHTALLPIPDQIDMNHKELHELKRLFPKKYKVVEFVVRYSALFKLFHSCDAVYKPSSSIVQIEGRRALYKFFSNPDWEQRYTVGW